MKGKGRNSSGREEKGEETKAVTGGGDIREL